MLLYLMRHGLAEEPTPDGEDGARKLTPEGVDKIRKAAIGLRSAGFVIEMILASPIARAQETAELVAREFERLKPRIVPELTTGAAPAGALDALGRLQLPENALAIGHEPTLSRLASLMLAGSSESIDIKLKPGSVIALEFDDRIGKGAAKLRWMMTQRQLRQLRK
jgi:phosphohistidine phosphatase